VLLQVRVLPGPPTLASKHPASGDLIDFNTSEDDRWISKVSQSSPMVFAVNGDNPYVETPTNAHEINIRVNRVSGRVQVDWHWHEVRDYLPFGATRSIKERYSDHKLFTADYDVMRQRLF
jgi:hypothetical protein